jgi:hypothetical protein
MLLDPDVSTVNLGNSAVAQWARAIHRSSIVEVGSKRRRVDRGAPSLTR